MTVLRGFIITIASGVAFACLGGLLGVVLGKMVPDYYRIVFNIPADAGLDPLQVGLGLGISQGLAIGLLIGLVITVTVAWYNSRLAATPGKSPL